MLSPSSNVAIADTPYGLVSYYRDDQYIGHALRVYGEYSEGEPALWRKFLQPGDVVADVGANIGYLTLALSTIVGPGGAVHAFEPQPENFKLLQQNCRGRDHITCHELALGQTSDTVMVPSLADLDNTNYGDVRIGSGSNAVVMATLDSCDIPELRFIKIDVEGAEAEVLRGAVATIEKLRPVLYVENDRVEKSEDLIKLINGLDYRMYMHKPLIWVEPNFKDTKVTDEPLVSKNILCIPKERVKDLEQNGVMEGLSMLLCPVHSRQGKAGWAGIVRMGGIGDNLIAAATLKPLKAMGYKIDVISQEPQSCVYENNPYIDKISVKMAERDIPKGDMLAWQKYWRSRSYEYDKFANLSHSNEHLLAQFPAATAYWWPAHYRRKMCNHSYLETVCDIVGVPYDWGPLFFPTADEREDAARMKAKVARGGRKVVGWAVTGTRVDKIYPQSAMTIGRLIKELNAAVIMFGAPPPYPDINIVKEIIKTVTFQNGSENGLHSACNDDVVKKWSIRMILTMAGVCDLMIGPDTGAMWGVAMEELPKIMLLSHASPENITKNWVNTTTLHADQKKVGCWPCHLLHDVVDTCNEMQIEAGLKPTPEDKGAACISSINAEDIVAAAARSLR